MRATFTKRAAGTTSTMLSTTAIRRSSGSRTSSRLWKAEKWEPERLMALYKKAGAKYFCMIAEHHDNFDCWNSKFQRWNSVNMGPKRDIAGEWQQAATKQGLRFGMTEHLAASWWFYSAAKGADTNGPMAGVAYDGADPKYADLYWSADNEQAEGHYYDPHGARCLQADVVQPDQGHDRSLSSRPAVFRQPAAVSRRVRPATARALLQRQPAAARRQTRSGLQLQAGFRRPVGAGSGARRHGRHQPAPLADRHLRRRLVLRREGVGAPRLQNARDRSSTCSATSSARTATCC